MRDVLKVTKKAEIETELRNGGVALGSSQMISKYQATVTHVINNLPEEVLEEAQQMAKTWNEERPPPKVQAE